MSDSFEFKDDNLNINVNIYEADDTEGHKFIAETVFDYVAYKSCPTFGKGFEHIEISNFHELHEMFPPEVNMLDIKTIKISYSIPFLKSTFDFFLKKEEVTAAKETLIKYKKHTEIINKLEQRVSIIEELKPVSSKPYVVDILYDSKQGLYFASEDIVIEDHGLEDVGTWFLDIMHKFYKMTIYPTYNSGQPAEWRTKYKNIKDLFKDVQNLYYNDGQGKKQYTDLLSGLSKVFSNSHSDNSCVPYAIYCNYMTLGGYSLKSHISGNFPLSFMCNELNETSIRVGSVYLFDVPKYRIYRGPKYNEEYMRSIMVDELNPIYPSVSHYLFGIYPNALFNAVSNMSIWNGETLAYETCRVVWF